MPIKYQRSDVTGESWMRAGKVVFENPPQGNFVCRFSEEKAVVLAGGEIITQKLGVLEASKEPEKLDESFELLNPETGEGSGSFMTYAQLHTALYSLYMQTSMEHHGVSEESGVNETPPEEAPPVE